MDLSIEHFGDIHLHAESVREWSQTYSQLTSGSVQSSLLQLTGPRFQVFRESINQRVVQHGEAPRGRICFAIPLVVPGAARMQGREADGRSVFVLQGGEEFMFHMPMGMDMLAFTFDRGTFEQAVASEARPEELDTLLKQPVVQIPADRLDKSRNRLVGLFEEALLMCETISAEVESWIQAVLIGEMISLLSDPTCDKHQRHGSSSGSYIVEKCHQLTVREKLNPPSVFDLCRRLRISRRSVQNGFRSVAETTPVNYIRCIRLNGVRRELMSTRVADMTIGDAAAQWGFFHLSHFAADYHLLFGELPSQTLRLDGYTGRPTVMPGGLQLADA